MSFVPMLYVNAITGANKGRRWFCYVCQYGSAPVVAVFIKPEALGRPGLLEAIQKLDEKYPELNAFVVLLAGPDEALEKRLQDLALEKELSIPLTVLPEPGEPTGLYRALPIDPQKDVTLLLYSGRQVVKKFEDPDFGDALLAPAVAPDFAGEQEAAVGPLPASNWVDSTTFRNLDEAAKSLVAGP